MELYEWQKKIVEHEGKTTTKGGRQSGKTKAHAHRILHLAKKYPKSKRLVIGASQRQEEYLREEILQVLGPGYKGRKRITLKHIALGPDYGNSDIYFFPVGRTGVFVEGLASVDFITVEEAGHVSESVFDAILPMTLEPRKRGLGWIDLLGTTRFVKIKGYFYESFKRKDFFQTTIRSEDQEHADIDFLREEKERLGDRMYKVIYCAEFDEWAFRYFSPEKVKERVKFKFWKPDRDLNESCQYYLGVDPARYGKSKAGFVVAELSPDRKRIRIIHAEFLRKSSLTDLRDKTKRLNEIFKFKKIFIDGGGFGAGLIDILEDEFKSKVRDLNNREKGKFGKILKEDLYSNLNRLIETGEIDIIGNNDLIEELCTVEVDEEEKITGGDLAEAAVRATWCSKEKKNRLFVI